MNLECNTESQSADIQIEGLPIGLAVVIESGNKKQKIYLDEYGIEQRDE